MNSINVKFTEQEMDAVLRLVTAKYETLNKKTIPGIPDAIYDVYIRERDLYFDVITAMLYGEDHS